MIGGRQEKKGAERENLNVEIKNCRIQCLHNGLRGHTRKRWEPMGTGLRNSDLKYLGNGVKFYGLIIIGRNFGVRFVGKQRSWYESVALVKG